MLSQCLEAWLELGVVHKNHPVHGFVMPLLCWMIFQIELPSSSSNSFTILMGLAIKEGSVEQLANFR